jgi:hypothetical protein
VSSRDRRESLDDIAEKHVDDLAVSDTYMTEICEIILGSLALGVVNGETNTDPFIVNESLDLFIYVYKYIQISKLTQFTRSTL